MKQFALKKLYMIGNSWSEPPLSVTALLKGQSHEILCACFFHQSAHSDPIRDVFEF